jgi:hypothetical protein
MTKTSLTGFNEGFDALKVFVLSFVFWSFEFVSNFDIRISNLLDVIDVTLYKS